MRRYMFTNVFDFAIFQFFYVFYDYFIKLKLEERPGLEILDLIIIIIIKFAYSCQDQDLHACIEQVSS